MLCVYAHCVFVHVKVGKQALARNIEEAGRGGAHFYPCTQDAEADGYL